MFIPLLDTPQQEALCRILLYVAHVDGIEDHREAALSSALLEESHLEAVPEPVADLREASSLLPVFDTSRSKRVLLLEALGIVLADAVAHPKELEVIQSLAQDMAISEQWLGRAHDFVQRALDLQHEGRDLLD